MVWHCEDANCYLKNSVGERMKHTIKAYTELNNKTVVAFKGGHFDLNVKLVDLARTLLKIHIRSRIDFENFLNTNGNRLSARTCPSLNSRNANNEF